MIGKRQMNKIAIISLFILTVVLGMTINCIASESGIRLEADDSNLEIGVSTNISVIIDNLKDASLEKIEGLENFDTLGVEEKNISNTNLNNNSRVVINQIQPTETNGDYFIIKKSYVYVLLILMVVLVILFLIIFIIRKYKIRGDQQLRSLYQQVKKAKNNNKRYELLNEMIKYRYHVSLKTTSRSELKNYIEEKVYEDVLSIIDIMEKSYQSGQIKEESIADLISKVYKQL